MNSSLLIIFIGGLLGFISCITFFAINARNHRQARALIMSRVNDAETILNNQIAEIDTTELLLTEPGKELLVMLEVTPVSTNDDSETSMSEEHIQEKLKQAVNKLGNQKGENFPKEISPIILRNHERGRVEAFLDSRNASIQDYVQVVIDNYKRKNQYIHELQVERSAKVWEALFSDMQKWAYQYLIQKGYTANELTLENANECATEAAINILSAEFPYDTEFESWVRVLVQHACLKFIKHSTNDTLIDKYNKAIGPSSLVEAMNQLSSSRRQVIEMLYFQNLSPDEVAKKMEKSVGSVYSLQFHALQDLRKILTQNSNKFIEENIEDSKDKITSLNAAINFLKLSADLSIHEAVLA